MNAVICPSCKRNQARQIVSFPAYVIFQCADCSQTFGVPDTPVTKSSFDNYPWTREWTNIYPQHVQKACYSLRQKLALISSLRGAPVRSMLEVGCGNGAYLAAAKALGVEAEGIDVDLDHFRYAEAQGFKAFHCDIHDFKPTQKYDFIHIKETFHLIPDTWEFVERVATLLNPGGILYVDSTHADGLAARYRKFRIKPPRYGQLYPPLHNRTFSRESMTRVLRAAGFDILKCVTFNKGNPTYCPTPKFTSKQYVINPLLDLFFLGGFIGCYARLSRETESRAISTDRL